MRQWNPFGPHRQHPPSHRARASSVVTTDSIRKAMANASWSKSRTAVTSSRLRRAHAQVVLNEIGDANGSAVIVVAPRSLPQESFP